MKIDSAKRQEREAYVAGKVLDEARANDEFFSGASDNAQSDLGLYASQLIQKHQLTKNQSARLMRTAERAHKAREIVSYLGEKFGVDEFGSFNDASGLYRVVFGRKAPASIEAYNRGLAVEFEINNWRYTTAMGLAGRGGIDYDQLSAPLEQTKKRIETGKTTHIGQVAFRLPSVEKIARKKHKREWLSHEDRLIEQMFGPQQRNKSQRMDQAKAHQESTRRHEIKHVYDNIMGSNLDFHIETSAYLYQGKPIKHALYYTRIRLLRGLGDRAEKVRKRAEKYRALNLPEQFVDGQLVLLRNLEGQIKEISEHFADLDTKLDNFHYAKGEVGNKTLSYVFSVSPQSRIVRRIDCINKKYTPKNSLVKHLN